ncbi:MAG TPA: glycoside hydrolase family 13 protein [Herpetosiphonaceae bacterium]
MSEQAKSGTPAWVKDAIFYQIFPDRFAKSERVLKPSNLKPWDSIPIVEGYFGGDLYGVLEHLDHIEELGATAIYFTPIFASASNHRYHTADYYQVDPMLGGNEALRDLIDECHRRGMRVVLDGVFNHASRAFLPFNDILEHGPHSAYIDWFFVEGWPLSPYDGDKPANYVSWVNNRALPKFNTDNPVVREYIMRVGEFWLREFNIDGWRLDVPFEITTPGFWQEFRQRVRAINPDAYIVGEVWTDARQWLQGDQFDAVMNYLFTAPLIAFTAGDRVVIEMTEDRSYDPYPALDAPGFARKIEALIDMYDWEHTQAQMNLLDSHDTARLLSMAQEDKATVRLATLFQMTYPGAPSIYYGDEIGLPGALDPDSRRGMPWEREKWDAELFDYFKGAIQLRKNHAVLRHGGIKTVYAEGSVYAMARTGDDETLLIALNVAESEQQITFTVGEHFGDDTALHSFFGPKLGGVVQNGQISLTLPAREGVVIGES